MRRQLQTILVSALFTVAACAMASAQDANDAKQAPTANQPARASDAGQRAVTPAIAADAPNARLAALIRRDLVIQRNKNVASVTRPRAGVYCITPKPASGITPSTAIVTVTPEFFFSLLNEIQVQWASSSPVCGNSTIAVYTFSSRGRDGFYVLTNDVSFSIVVP